MPYFEVETDIAVRCFVKAQSINEVITKMKEEGIDECNIMQISRVHYNKVII